MGKRRRTRERRRRRSRWVKEEVRGQEVGGGGPLGLKAGGSREHEETCKDNEVEKGSE